LHTLKGNILPGHQDFAVQHEFSRTRRPLYLILQSNYQSRPPHVILLFSPPPSHLPRHHPPPHLPPSSATFQLRPTPSIPSLVRRPLRPPTCLPLPHLLLPPPGASVPHPRSAGSDPRAGGSSSTMAHGGPAGELAYVAGPHLPTGDPPRAASPLLSSPPLPPPRCAAPSLAAVGAPWLAQDLRRRGATWPAPPSAASRSSSHLLPPHCAAVSHPEISNFRM
jgi:hypothetical protein